MTARSCGKPPRMLGSISAIRARSTRCISRAKCATPWKRPNKARLCVSPKTSCRKSIRRCSKCITTSTKGRPLHPRLLRRRHQQRNRLNPPTRQRQRSQSQTLTTRTRLRQQIVLPVRRQAKRLLNHRTRQPSRRKPASNSPGQSSKSKNSADVIRAVLFARSYITPTRPSSSPSRFIFLYSVVRLMPS
jgi:hypothetical protein